MKIIKDIVCATQGIYAIMYATQHYNKRMDYYALKSIEICRILYNKNHCIKYIKIICFKYVGRCIIID